MDKEKCPDYLILNQDIKRTIREYRETQDKSIIQRILNKIKAASHLTDFSEFQTIYSKEHALVTF